MQIIRRLLAAAIGTGSDDHDDDHNGLDELDDLLEEHDFKDFMSIVRSSKYADSNSNTERLEKLLAMVDIRGEDEFQDKDEKDSGENEEEEEKAIEEERIKNKVSIESIICRDSEEILPGQPCYMPAKFGKQGGTNFTLRKFDIPRWIYAAIRNNNVDALRVASPLTMDNYVQRFQTLLWVEEAQQAMEMRRYDMYDVMLGKFEDFFVLEVPGLAEGRPSLLRGDRLILRSDHRSSYYEGYIHEVRERDILFKLNEYLHTTAMDGLRFTIQFLSSRTPYRRCHHGVLQFKERAGLNQVIFPMHIIDKPTMMIRAREHEHEQEMPCFNEKLNEYQRRAVINVLRGQSRPAPYIIFGPPGTGKTVTMVEAILQVYARAPDYKILVCANSNSSADILARRIQASNVVEKEELIRVSAFYRMEKLVPPDLEAITKDMDNIDADSYRKCRVVVTTCIHSGSLYEFRDHFDFVFIDEAGHASEPEALVPMGLLHRGGCCVLAGDPHQLGPVCVSQVASQYGMGTSLLERLCRRSLYQRNALRPRDNKMDYNNRYITKLRICYRCDARVLSINNELFYDNDLKCTNQTPPQWLNLFKVDKPLIFHCVRGRDKREFTNPSWFNPAEAIRCLSYVKRLYDYGLRSHQLGIITPYRRQIDKLNLLFESCHLEKCKIATMEEFQGDEREVIIISTVRTRERKIDFDKKFQLGFLFNPRRFNVAISRAKWLVIVVGDSAILSRDQCWTKYMERAYNFEDPPPAVQRR